MAKTYQAGDVVTVDGVSIILSQRMATGWLAREADTGKQAWFGDEEAAELEIAESL